MAALTKPRVDDAANDAALVTAFTEFTARLGCSVGERHEGFQLADHDCPESLIHARTDALLAAFACVGRIAARTL